jgi:hypothetical protein
MPNFPNPSEVLGSYDFHKMIKGPKAKFEITPRIICVGNIIS